MSHKVGTKRFDEISIGDRFFHASSYRTAAVFEKKSLSSAYTLDPVTMERTKLPAYARDICEFYGGVDVYPFSKATGGAQ